MRRIGVLAKRRVGGNDANDPNEIAPELTGHGLPLSKCEAYNPVSMTNSSNRVEIITSVRRRRRWTAPEKVRMVEETFEPGMTVSLVARRHGVAPNVSRADSVGVPQRMSRGLPECSAVACPTPIRTLSPTMPNDERQVSLESIPGSGFSGY